MQLTLFKNTNEMVDLACAWCERKIKEYKASSMFIPAGSTPVPIYVKWVKEKPEYLKNIRLLQVDDISTGKKKRLFWDFFQKMLPTYHDQLISIESGKHFGDLAILGFGVNGHIAFHEPGVPADFEYGEVELKSETCMNLGITEGTKGLTYGAKALLNAHAILLIVSGKNKKKSFQAFLDDDTSLPATLLKKHADITVLVVDGLVE